MRMIWSYFRLQLKRCMKSFLAFLLIVVLVGALFTGLYFGIMHKLSSEGSIAIAKVGMVVPDEETKSMYVTDIIASMDTVKSICSFEYMPYERAMEELEGGRLNAVIELSENFFYEVQVGVNPPAIVYFPKKQGLLEKVFKEILLSGVTYLDTAEAAVYAGIDTQVYFDNSTQASQTGNAIAVYVLNEALKRNTLYETTTLTPVGSLGLLRYYFLSGMVFSLMFSGLIYGRMYSKEDRAVAQKLRINGISGPVSFFTKLLIMILGTWLSGMCIYLSALWISSFSNIGFVENNPVFLLRLLQVSILISIYFAIVYFLGNDKRFGRILLTIINITGAMCSGLIIPMVYLSEGVREIGAYLPMKYWIDMLKI